MQPTPELYVYLVSLATAVLSFLGLPPFLPFAALAAAFFALVAPDSALDSHCECRAFAWSCVSSLLQHGQTIPDIFTLISSTPVMVVGFRLAPNTLV